MPSFVNMASLTKLSSITGNEEFQVSATNKISSRDIASLALTQQLHGLSEVTVGSPKISSTSLLLSAIAALYRLSSDNGKILPISNGIDKFGNVVFYGTNAVGILFDVKASKYFTRSGVTATASFNSEQWISWLQDGEAHEMDGGSGVADPIQINNFAEVSAIDNWPTPKDGLIIPFVTDSGVLNKPGNESEYVGIIICEVDTQNTGRAEVIAYGSGTGACYVGLLDYASVSIEWMVNKMSVAGKKLSAFTGTAIGNYIQSMGNAGDLFPFVTVNANKTTANQFPANGAWSGFVTIGDGGGVNIIAFKSTNDPNAEVYVGRCSGGTTQWTLVGGGGLDVINVPMGGDIGSIIAGANWKQTGMEGEMKAVFVLDPASVVGDYFPNLKNAQTLTGFAQCVYDGSDYQYFITTLFPYTDTLRNLSKEYGRILSETNGDVIDYEEYPHGGIALGTVIFNDEFLFYGYTSANPGQLSLLQPIPLGSVVTFIGSHYYGLPGEEILLSPESSTWSLTVALPTGASNFVHHLKDMLVVQNPETNLVVDRQSAMYKIGAKNLVNGKISTIDMYATGALLSDMCLTIEQIIYVAQV